MKYATLEGRPVIITYPGRADGYWLIDGQWVLMWPGDVVESRVKTKEEFERRFPDLPPLPAERR